MKKNEPSIDDLPCNGHFPIHFPVRCVHLLESKMNMKKLKIKMQMMIKMTNLYLPPRGK